MPKQKYIYAAEYRILKNNFLLARTQIVLRAMMNSITSQPIAPLRCFAMLKN
jgi:hypothetical protein